MIFLNWLFWCFWFSLGRRQVSFCVVSLFTRQFFKFKEGYRIRMQFRPVILNKSALFIPNIIGALQSLKNLLSRLIIKKSMKTTLLDS